MTTDVTDAAPWLCIGIPLNKHAEGFELVIEALGCW